MIRTNKWCWINNANNPTSFQIGEPATVTFEAENTSDEGGVLPYMISVMGPDMTPDAAVVRLNGFEPGTPVEYVLNLQVGQSTTVAVEVEFLEHVPFAFFDLLISGDENDDGDSSEVMNSHGMHSVPAESVEPIPTVSQWGLVVLTLLLLTGAKVYFARRQTETAQ